MTWEKFEQLLDTQTYTPEDRLVIRRAFVFAEHLHQGQKRASGHPYFSHVYTVASSIAQIKLDAEAIAAALLHDTVEDCGITQKDIEREFGVHIAFLVEGVTKLDKIKYHGVERRVESLRKMFLAIAEDVRVLLIKLYGRLHNMQPIRYLPPEKQKRIALESLELYAPLAYRLGIGELKGQLQDLAFPVLYPEEYLWLKKEMDARLPEGTTYLKKVKPILEQTLRKNGIVPKSIDFRTKHYYSLWKKLTTYDMDFARVTDLLAMRIIVKNIEDCYQTLGAIHSAWRPLPGRIKDYIALPKPNGYRSLHTTVFCLGGKVTEFQIRTQEMHNEAEYGITAHWAYEEAGKPKKGTRVSGDKLSWVRQLKDWQKEVGATVDGEEFIESVKIDFFKDRIFVLTPTGEVIDLPEGATPVDFAYHIHTDIGDHMAGAKVNNKMAPFAHKLLSGDTVEVLTQKNRHPTDDWLTFVKTSHAKAKIRSTLRKQAILQTHLDPRTSKKTERFEMYITARDRVGLLKDISAAYSFFRISIQNVSMNTQNKAYPVILIYFEGKDEKQTGKLLARVKSITGIEAVTVKLGK